MWHSPTKYSKEVLDFNIEAKALKGELDDIQAKITLAKFLYRNLGITTNFLTGIDLYPDQIITIKGMLQSNYTLCVWGRGVSKSVSYSNTWVIDQEKGLLLLKDLFPNLDFSKDQEVNIPTRKFWNGSGWQATSKLFIQPKKDSLRIKTKRGYSLEGAKTHIIKVWDKTQCKVVWKKYPEITKDDYICINRNRQNEWGEATDANESYLIGLILGDGCISSHNPSTEITTADEEISDFCLKYGANIHLKKNTRAWDLYFPKDIIDKFLGKYQVKRGLSYDKIIPQTIFSSKQMLKACLQGLFDTDGCVTSSQLTVEYCSTSIEMARQVHFALLTFGIVSHLMEYKIPSPFGHAWKVIITGQDCRIFSEQIGFRLSRKQNILNQHLLNGNYNTNIDVIPGLKEYCQREIKSKARLPKILSDEWRNKIRRKDNQLNLTYDTLDSYLEFFVRAGITGEHIENLKSIKNEHFFFDQVESIEDIGGRDCLDFNIPDGEMYWSNGFISHNTWTAAVYCILQMIFFPKSSILIAGPTFRTARFIFNHIEKIVNQPEAQMLAAAFNVDFKVRRNDEFRWSINGGEIVAIPLNGEKIRGFRANVLLIDEFLLMSEDLVEKVLIPYLVSPTSAEVKRRKQIRDKESDLIQRGIITETERTKFTGNAKLIALSSASYTCEYLYKKYDDYVKKIYSPDLPDEGAKYFVSQLSWDAIPEDRMDKSIIEMAQTNESNMATFKREYCAQFLDGSDSYFSMQKMIACTVPDGEKPTLLVRGKRDKKYILAIDPDFSNSPTGDDFAMCVVELDDNGKGGTVAHTYAESGKDLKDHIRYLHYILTNFGIDMIIIDYAGYQFIEAANESQLFRDANMNLSIFDFTSEKDGEEYNEELRKARNSYNKQIGRIVFNQYFTSDFIRKANEWLQGCFDYKRLWFGGSIKGCPEVFNEIASLPIDFKQVFANKDLDDKNETPMGYMIDRQEILCKQTKYQCASIEVKTSQRGVQSFDLPLVMKRDNTASRMRRDSYTACMLAAWCMKSYNDIMAFQPTSLETFEPMMI
jgi:hypothetical protein